VLVTQAVPDGEAIGPHILVRASIDPNGRDLVVDFVGGSETLFDYEAETVETPAALTVLPRSARSRRCRQQRRSQLRATLDGSTVRLNEHLMPSARQP